MQQVNYGLGEVQSLVKAFESTNFVSEHPEYKQLLQTLVPLYKKQKNIIEVEITFFLEAIAKLGFDFNADYLTNTEQAQDIYNKHPSKVVTMFEELQADIKSRKHKNSLLIRILNDTDAFVFSLIGITIASVFGVIFLNAVFFDRNSDGIVEVNYNSTTQEDSWSKAQTKFTSYWQESKDSPYYLSTGGKVDVFTKQESSGTLKCYTNKNDKLPTTFLPYQTQNVGKDQAMTTVKIPAGITKIKIVPD